jgi:hypothetical protein
MALQARLLVHETLLHHPRACAHSPRGSGRSVRIVTVRTRHYSLVHPVLERHVELRPHLRVALVAKVYLLLGEEIFRRGGTVNGMAVRADNVILRVFRALDLGSIDVFGVAGKTVIHNTLRRELAERDDRRFTATSFHMRLSRTVARLTSGFFGCLFAGCDRSIVGIFVKVSPNVRVARFTNRAADVLRSCGICRRLQRSGLRPGRCCR